MATQPQRLKGKILPFRSEKLTQTYFGHRTKLETKFIQCFLLASDESLTVEPLSLLNSPQAI
ncbi:hypothetical protein ACE1CI_07115, partial [Aerosakkonemataceae cyanobacterium BLCC-F50]